ncbi:MAG: hypothetical protein Q7R47_05770, partial [Candidatus Diapherotrites archaeon]|nr:hypothetical protein [Candidatus Diapherotrites archaeon]
AFARVSLISPVLYDLDDRQSVSIGALQPGETLELFFNRKNGLGENWSSVTVDPASVPAGWVVEGPSVLPESIGLKISVPSTEIERVQSLRFSFVSAQGASETINLSLTIRNDLLQFSVVPLSNDINQGQSAVFVFRVLNQSLASHSFVLSSTLPDSSFKSRVFSLEGVGSEKSQVDLNLVVVPNTYGHRDFSFRAVSRLNDKTLDLFNETLTVHPTLKGKYHAGQFGLPVLLPNLNMFYFFNAFVSLLQ